jgi:hypothetical protein
VHISSRSSENRNTSGESTNSSEHHGQNPIGHISNAAKQPMNRVLTLSKKKRTDNPETQNIRDKRTRFFSVNKIKEVPTNTDNSGENGSALDDPMTTSRDLPDNTEYAPNLLKKVEKKAKIFTPDNVKTQPLTKDPSLQPLTTKQFRKLKLPSNDKISPFEANIK